jgi:hypothetical protein
MQKKILFAAIFVFAAIAGNAQQKQTEPAKVTPPVIKTNQKKLKTSPASKFQAQPRRHKSEAVKFTPPVIVRDPQPATKPKKG